MVNRKSSDFRLNSFGEFSRLLFIRTADEHRKSVVVQTRAQVSGTPQGTDDRVADLPKHRIGRVATEKGPIFGEYIHFKNDQTETSFLATGFAPVPLNRFFTLDCLTCVRHRQMYLKCQIEN